MVISPLMWMLSLMAIGIAANLPTGSPRLFLRSKAFAFSIDRSFKTEIKALSEPLNFSMRFKKRNQSFG